MLNKRLNIIFKFKKTINNNLLLYHKKNSKITGLLNKNGNCSKLIFDFIVLDNHNYLDFNNTFLVKYKNLSGTIDINGNIILPIKYNFIESFKFDRCVITENINDVIHFSVIDKNYNTIISNEENYDYIATYFYKFTLFSKNNKFGIIDENANIIIQNKWSYIIIINNNLFLCVDDNKFSLLNYSNKKIIDEDFLDVEIPDNNQKYLIIKKLNQKYNLLDIENVNYMIEDNNNYIIYENDEYFEVNQNIKTKINI